MVTGQAAVQGTVSWSFTWPPRPRRPGLLPCILNPQPLDHLLDTISIILKVLLSPSGLPGVIKGLAPLGPREF